MTGRSRRRLKIAVAPNAFKGTLTAREAADCIATGLGRALPGARIRKIPMADGGDGTAQAIADATGGRMVRRVVTGPSGRRVRAAFALTGDGRTAVIEMATASGLALLRPRERNPMRTTTRGTGELIARALDLGVKRILVGIGGSATNDGGTGMARALGVKFLDAMGRELPGGGGALRHLMRIDRSGLHPRAAGATVDVACDVDNPLTGPRGAARVYGPQKGATPEMVRELDANLKRLARLIRRDVGPDILKVPGSGAAGGLGAGLMAFLNGRLKPGVELVMAAVKLERKLRGCDLVVTGEGRMDAQTASGKAPAGVARTARKLGLPVIAICGSLGKDVAKMHDAGIAAYFSALPESVPEEELSKRAADRLTACAEEVGRLIALRLTRFA